MPIPLTFGAIQTGEQPDLDFTLGLGTDPSEFLGPRFLRGGSRTLFGVEGALQEANTLRHLGQDQNLLNKTLFRIGETLGLADEIEPDPSRRIIPAEQANKIYGIKDKLVFDEPVNSSVAQRMHDVTIEREKRHLAAERANGFLNNVLAFTAEMAGELTDPLGVAFLIFPSFSSVKTGSFLTKAIRGRPATGAVEGAVGVAGATGLGAISGQDSNLDFTTQQLMVDVMFGAAFGAVAKTIIGKTADIITARASGKIAKDESGVVKEIAEVLENDLDEAEYAGVDEKTHEEAIRSGIADTLADNKVTSSERIVEIGRKPKIESDPINVKVTRVAENESGKSLEEQALSMPNDAPGIKRALKLLKEALTTNTPLKIKIIKKLAETGQNQRQKITITKNANKTIKDKIEILEKRLQEIKEEPQKFENAPSIAEFIGVLSRFKVQRDRGDISGQIKEDIVDVFSRAGIDLPTFHRFNEVFPEFEKRILSRVDELSEIPNSYDLSRRIAQLLDHENIDAFKFRANKLRAVQGIVDDLKNPKKENLRGEDIDDEILKKESEDIFDRGEQLDVEDFDKLVARTNDLQKNIEDLADESNLSEDDLKKIIADIEKSDNLKDKESKASLESLNCLMKTMNARRPGN